MQKKIIALAIAGLASGAALAQTNVTIYGIADAAYVYSSGDPGNTRGVAGSPGVGINGTNTFSGIQSGMLSGSRLGFKGEEALGNGLKAVFTLEYSLNIDTNQGIGTGNLNARQQFVGLSSDKLGTASLGRQYAPGYQAQINNDAFAGATFSPVSLLSAQAGNSIQGGSNARWNNAIAYTSPNWSGFTAKAIYSFGENSSGGYNNTGTSDNGQFGIGGNYANGGLNIDLVYQSLQNAQSTYASIPGYASLNPLGGSSGAWSVMGTGADVNSYYVGGSYDFKMVKIMGSWQQQNDKNLANLDNSVWQVGANIPVMAASNIMLTYAQLDWDMGSRGLFGTGGLTNKSQSAGVAWTTALSKRTTAYAGYVWMANDKNSSANAVVSGIGAVNEDNNTFLAGLRHSF